MTMVEIGNRIDVIAEGLRDDGSVVIKVPDVYSNAKMTKYRKDFERQMSTELGNFKLIISARTARLDAASTTSATSLGAALAPKGTAPAAPTINLQPYTPPALPTDTGAQSGTTLQSTTASTGIGLEPTVYLDQEKEFIDHLNEWRRVNMGSDRDESAGYALYLVRMPVSIIPGQKTREGYGAEMSVTVQHHFHPRFLNRAFRGLVINDVVEQLTPILYQYILAGQVVAQAKRTELERTVNGLQSRLKVLQSLANTGGMTAADEVKNLARLRIDKTRSDLAEAQIDLDKSLVANPFPKPLALLNSRGAKQAYPIELSEIPTVFLGDNLIYLAGKASDASINKTPRLGEIRAYLTQQLSVAYDVLLGPHPDVEPSVVFSSDLLDEIAAVVNSGEYLDRGDLTPSENAVIPAQGLEKLNRSLIAMLEGTGQRQLAAIGPLAWAIAVDAALLDKRLREAIPNVFVGKDMPCQDLGAVRFYRDDPAANEIFSEYVRLRWPVVTFAIDPIFSEQNIDESATMDRDLQLALAFAFSTGQINFNQVNTFRRKLEQTGETIALNRTITAFTHGNDVFSYRFMPRFQNPPNQRSNLGVIANQLISGGPGPNYGLKKSKLEPGQRELTVLIAAPSFLPALRFETTGNWFRLAQPDDLKVTTGRMLEEAHYVLELREALSYACNVPRYRPSEVRQLSARIDQLEAALPMQERVVSMPFDNTVAGFDLFTEGITVLAPELVGFEGIDRIDLKKATDLFLLGKNISIDGTKVIAGGRLLDDAATIAQPDGKTVPNAGRQVDILSREVIRVTLPADLALTPFGKGKPEDTQRYVEIHLATPNGVSNPLFIPVVDAGAVKSTEGTQPVKETADNDSGVDGNTGFGGRYQTPSPESTRPAGDPAPSTPPPPAPSPKPSRSEPPNFSGPEAVPGPSTPPRSSEVPRIEPLPTARPEGPEVRGAPFGSLPPLPSSPSTRLSRDPGVRRASTPTISPPASPRPWPWSRRRPDGPAPGP